MARVVLVTGASGFIGSHLAPALVERGYAVRAMTRHPDRYRGAGVPVYGDVSDPASLSGALDGTDAAYYLVHALGSADFAARDAQAARNFAAAAADAGLERIVYLGGLGESGTRLSEHLRSRREVERLLMAGRVPVTALRAAVVIGPGSIAWEITRQLVEHLPMLVTPRWAGTRTQPIALPDVIRYLVGVLEPRPARGRVYEIGGPEVLRYVDMLQRTARIRGRPVPNVTVPLLTPRLSAAWLALVTDVDMPTARNLVDSLRTEVVVHEHSIDDIVPDPPIGFDDAVRLALREQAAA
ncbi:NAD(P)H-binding protein [Dactylosporangium sp. CA-092794]|uniref:NAD(P)H-binding protein n=1 Tax=Dactylosporangium sp. CA-092794 TaxID=3239929 RepID=UPI003D9044CD